METIRGFATGQPVILLGFLGSLAAGIPTGVGALPILFVKTVSQRAQNIMLGFGGGVMLAATAFSLILPGIEAAFLLLGDKGLAGLLIAAGMLIGGVCLWAANLYFPHSHGGESPYQIAAISLHRAWLFTIAITIHNVPEGLAVGVGFGTGDVANGVSLALGIGIQNLPEGLVVAMALAAAGYSRGRAFLIGALSGMVEPVGGLVGAGVVTLAAPLLPWGLAFAAGAMLFVISQEVIPEIHRERRESINTFGLLIGFVLMMFLDNVLG